jgi:hypothetical protein
MMYISADAPLTDVFSRAILVKTRMAGGTDMRLAVDRSELMQRAELNFRRLSEDNYYRISGVFSPPEYDWAADKEGRALLAFMSHFKLSGRTIECMELLLEQLPGRLNGRGYMGRDYGKVLSEQQLSGHSWLLRGLCEHYEQFGDALSLRLIRSVAENLYLPSAGRYHTYPIHRSEVVRGGVSGTELGETQGWRLSTDVGCAFMSIDGLSHAYALTRDERILALLDEMIGVFLSIDRIALRMQTHCTLSAGRGMMRLYRLTENETYLCGAQRIWTDYVQGGGMTLTCQNLNWWLRPDTWTEPCAIVDSMMLSAELYKATGAEQYRTAAARIWHNGMATAQRDNGGAGTDSVVCPGGTDTLYMKSYEAAFCCSMRLAEGLWYACENAELLYARLSERVERGADGVYRCGDIVYAQPSGGLENFVRGFTVVDGHKLAPIVKYYGVPKEIIKTGSQRIVFD